MTDLDILRTFRANVPAPDSTGELRARRALLRQAVAPQARRRAGNRRRSLIMLGAALTVAVIVVPTIRLGGSSVPASASATAVLRQAATAAGEQPGGWPDARYWHAVSHRKQGSGPLVRREVWIGHTTTGALKRGGLSARVEPLGIGVFDFGHGGISWDELYALPTAPSALEKRLREGPNGLKHESQLFYAAATMLQETPASPALRQALFEMAANLPGASLVGPQTDALGRAGVAVRLGPLSYLIDPDSGRLLEYRKDGSTTSEPGVPCGTRYVVTYDEQGPAISAPPVTNHTGVSDDYGAGCG